MTCEIDKATEAMKEQIAKMMQGFKLPDVDISTLVDNQRRNIEAMSEPFASKRGGSGLGLSTSRGIVEAFGGKIWAMNKAGGGAVFQFTLPLFGA